MPESESRETELSQVALARIEGKIDLIRYQGEVFGTDLTLVKTDVAKLKTDVHTLQLNEVARDKLAATVATTLKDKDQADVADSERKWSPISRVYLVFGLAYVIVSLYLQISSK